MASCEQTCNNVSQNASPSSGIHTTGHHVAVTDLNFRDVRPATLASFGVSVTESTAPPTEDIKISDHTVICVICLELVDDNASALPCRHNHFHFSCLGTWLHQSRICPLCKTEVLSVQYRDNKAGSTSTFHLPGVNTSLASHEQRDHQGAHSNARHRAHHEIQQAWHASANNSSITFRRQLYERGVFSLYVGNNRVSGYKNITPASFLSNHDLSSRAKKWIRRELSALDPFSEKALPTGTSQIYSARDFRNNEYLLEYMIAILKHIDLKGSAGQAEILLREHLGHKNARIFLHELENWLRSPFESLEDWDAFVQYSESNHDRCA